MWPHQEPADVDGRPAIRRSTSRLAVAGAQAVYLHAGAIDIGIAPYTTDGDLALDPALLHAEPELAAAMRAANFHPDLKAPGIWLATATVDGDELTIPVDLIVPEGAAEPGAAAAPG